MTIEADADERMASERIGRVLGGTWKLERLLGVGGMAAVYASRDKAGNVAALKVLHPEMCRRADIRQRFAQEGTAATRVGHPSVVAVLGNGEEPDGTAFLVLELLEGDTLNGVLNRDGTLPLPRLLDILDEVLDVLAAAHDRGIVHRDLKPDNLFLTADGKIKVLDFGIARVLDDVPGSYKTRTGITLGTVPFMSPEQALGKRAQVDGRSDIFSLGAMMFRILAGRHVHTAETDAELLVAMASKPAPPLASVAPGVSPGLCSVVDLALAFSKDSRYPDARTMQTDLRAVKAGNPPPHANRVLASREMATRTDLPAPAISVVAGPKGVTIPEATAATRPDTHTAAPLGQRAPAGVLPTATVPETPAFTVADTAPPASFRGAELARDKRMDPEQAIATTATTAQNPAFNATTAKMVAPPDGRTITSTPPAKRARWIIPAILGVVGVAAAGGGYVAFTQSRVDGAGAAPADPSAVQPVTAGAGPSNDPAAAAAAAQTQQGTINPQTPAALQPTKQFMLAKPGAPTTASPGAATGATPAPTAAPTNPSPTNAALPPAPPPTPTTAPAPQSPPAPAPAPNPPPSPTSPPTPPSPPSPTHTTPSPPPAPTPTTTTTPSPSSKWKPGHKHR